MPRRLKPIHLLARKPTVKQWLARLPRGETVDMFDGVRVTWDEVLLWCNTVAGLAADSPRLARYVEGWNVPGKVATAKADGGWGWLTTSARR